MNIQLKLRNRTARTLLASLIFALIQVVPSAITAAPAHATVSACDSSNYTITPVYASKFYLVDGSSAKSAYIQYDITNRTGSDKTLVATIGNFSGGSVVLASQEVDSRTVLITAGATKSIFWYLTAGAVTGVAQTHDVVINVSGTDVCQKSGGFSGVVATITAASNKITSVANGSLPAINGDFNVTVTGQTGTIGSGPTAENDVNLNPATDNNFRADAYRLSGVSYTCGGVTVTQKLRITNACAGTYRAVFTFTYLIAAPNVAIAPIMQISSGTQMKHNPTPTAAILGAPSTTTTFATSLTGTSAVLHGISSTSIVNAYFCFSVSSPGINFASPCTDTVTATGSAASGWSADKTGLTPGTLYFFEIWGFDPVNPATPVKGGVLSFYTPNPANMVDTTTAATLITTSSARLNGYESITVSTGIVPTTTYFVYSTVDPSLPGIALSGHFDPFNGDLRDAETGTVTGTAHNSGRTDYFLNLSGLSSGTTYFFEIISIDFNGTFYWGGILKFTTLTPPPPPPAPTPLNPTITWPNPVPQVGPYNLNPTQLNAVCSVPGSVLTYTPSDTTLLQPGTYTLSVTCTPPAGSGYVPLTTTVPFTVLAPATLTWPNPSNQEGPYSLSGLELNAVCTIPGGTLTYDPTLGTTLQPGSYTLKVTCTPPAGSPYSPLTTTVPFTVTAPKVIDILPPVTPTAQLISPTSSTINWGKSPNGTDYYVLVNGVRVCTTSSLSCVVNQLVGPKSDIKIFATRENLTSTFVKPQILKPSKPQVIGIVYFATAKSNIDAAALKELKRVNKILQKIGYFDIVISGHTDSRSFDNLTLSNQRAKATKVALNKLLAGLNYDLKYSGATEPMASNKTVSGQAANRRAEIAVW